MCWTYRSSWSHLANEPFWPWVSSIAHILRLFHLFLWLYEPALLLLTLIATFNIPASLRKRGKDCSWYHCWCASDCYAGQHSLWSQKTTTYTLCIDVRESKLVVVLKDQKLFLMGNIESAELKTQLCGSNGNIISPVNHCSLSIHCVQGIHYSSLYGETSHHVLLKDIICLYWLRNVRGS